MNSQELRALQEAYNQVYSEGSFDNLIDTGASLIKKPVQDYANRKIGGLAGTLGIPGAVAGRRVDQTASDLKKGNYGRAVNTVVSGVRTLTQSYDLYDVILSHLLDEGYAETLEQAEVIMVNMSEDWRESIVEGAAGAFVPSKVDDSNNRRDMLKNRYGQDVSPRIPGPSGGGQFEKPSSNPAGALRLAKTSSKGNTKTA